MIDNTEPTPAPSMELTDEETLYIYQIWVEAQAIPSSLDATELMKLMVKLPDVVMTQERFPLAELATKDVRHALESLLDIAKERIPLADKHSWSQVAVVMLRIRASAAGTHNRVRMGLVEFILNNQPLSSTTVASPATQIVVPVETLEPTWGNVARNFSKEFAIEIYRTGRSVLRAFSRMTMWKQGLIVMFAFLLFFGPYWYYYMREPAISEADLTLTIAKPITNRKPVLARPVPVIDPADVKIGARRHEMTAEQKEIRELVLNDVITFFMLRAQNQDKGIKKVLELDGVVSESVRVFVQANPEMAQAFVEQLQLPVENMSDLILAMIWKESNGNWDAKSPTGPVGPLQFAKAAAIDENICGPVYEKDANGNFVLNDKGEKVVSGCDPDYRNDPTKAVPAALSLLKKKFYELGKRWDLAVFAYHSGAGDVKEVLAAAKADGLSWKTYYDLYFADPLKYPKTHKQIRKFSNSIENFGATYYPGVRRMMELIWIYNENQGQFLSLVAQQRSREPRNIKPGKGKAPCGDDPLCAPYMAYSWYGKDSMRYLNTADLLSALNEGELVPIESSTGINLRPPESGGIADEASSPDEARGLRSLKIPAYKAMGIVGAQFSRFFPDRKLDVTSAVRSMAYQRKVGKENLSVEMHVTGMTFDISQKGMSDEEQDVLRFILDEMQSMGLLSWIEEEIYNAFHIVVSPSDHAKSILAP